MIILRQRTFSYLNEEQREFGHVSNHLGKKAVYIGVNTKEGIKTGLKKLKSKVTKTPIESIPQSTKTGKLKEAIKTTQNVEDYTLDKLAKAKTKVDEAKNKLEHLATFPGEIADATLNKAVRNPLAAAVYTGITVATKGMAPTSALTLWATPKLKKIKLIRKVNDYIGNRVGSVYENAGNVRNFIKGSVNGVANVLFRRH